MMQSIEVLEGVSGRYLAAGADGSPVLLVHCSSGSHRQWSALMDGLSVRHRLFAPDLIGYGESDRWPVGRQFNPYVDVDLVLALMRRVGRPMHVVAHSYGATVALEAARGAPDLVRSMTLVEPVTFQVLRAAGRTAEWRQAVGVARRVRDAVAAGRPRRAAAAYMSYWIGPLRWLLMPRRQREGIVRTVDKVAHEFGAIERLSISAAQYAELIAPVRLIVGERSPLAARGVTELLSRSLPLVDVVRLDAGHMSPFTHRDLVNGLVEGHIEAVERLAAA